MEEEEGVSEKNLQALDKKHKPERIIIEYNGMWNFKNLKLPWYFKLEQQITIINGVTFPMYYTNMRSLLAEQIRNSEMIVMNRCDDVRDELSAYKRNIKAVNPTADVILEDSKGEIDEIFEDDLPYDLNADVIELDNQGYGLFYLDAMDHLERYEVKTIRFVGMVLKPDDFPKDYFVPGRMAMTCCAEDMAFLGYACEYEDTGRLNDQEWVKVTAEVKKGILEGL